MGCGLSGEVNQAKNRCVSRAKREIYRDEIELQWDFFWCCFAVSPMQIVILFLEWCIFKKEKKI